MDRVAFGLPLPRALIGTNTNKYVDQPSDKEHGLYKYSSKLHNHALHMTLDYVDISTNMRFARTYFLSNLSKGYMMNTFFSQNDDFRALSPEGKKNEHHTWIMFQVYTALIKVYEEVKQAYIADGSGETDLNDYAFGKMNELLRGVT